MLLQKTMNYFKSIQKVMGSYRRKLFQKKNKGSTSYPSEVEDNRRLELENKKQLRNLVSQGNKLLKEKKEALAEQIFQSILEQTLGEVDGYLGLAQVAQVKKNWTTALDYWNKCFSLKPKNYPTWWIIKKANVLIALNAIDEAELLLNEYCEKQPDQIWGYLGLAQIARQKQLPKKELNLWEKIYTDYPEYFEGQVNYARILCYFEKCDQAENILQNLKLQYPESEMVLETLAWTARGAKDYAKAAQRFGEVCVQFPNMQKYKRLYIQSLLDTVQFDEAQNYFKLHFHNSANPEDMLLQVKIFWEMLKTDEAIALLKNLLEKHPGDAGITLAYVGYLRIMYRPMGNEEFLYQALSLLNEIKEGVLKNDSLLFLQMEFYLMLDKQKKVIELFNKLEDKNSEKTLVWYAWKLKYDGNIEGAKTVWKQIQETFYIPQFQIPAEGTLQRMDSNSMEIEDGAVLLFTAVRNERWRLPWFLNYYRKLGVDRFFFVDNDSSDETSDYLLKQKDVHVFYTKQSYAISCSGMQWINHLVEKYGSNAWCMYVDVDEALVFPDSENKSLKDLSAYMEHRGHEVMYAFMLDMYAPGENPIPIDDEYTGFLQDYPLFENQYNRINSNYCPYIHTTGGIRRRFNIYENQTKTPIISGGRGIKFLMSSHQITPAKLSDVTGVLLHYKLVGNYKQIFSQDMELNMRTPKCRRRHWAYLQEADATSPDRDTENVVHYKSSQQLVDLGLIHTSEEFKSFEND